MTDQPAAERYQRPSEEVVEDEEFTDIQELFKMIKSEDQKTGLAGVMTYLSKHLNAWKKAEVNVAMVGNSGTGKSTLINTLRRLRPGDEGAALVGSSQTTQDIKGYEFPENKKITLWDIPGTGTDLWPMETYMSKIDAQKYDFFLIITAKRFTENDIILAENVIKLNKKFAYVRTRIDEDIVNEERDYELSKEEVLVKVRNEIQQSVAAVNRSKEPTDKLEPKALFLINGTMHHILDFPKLFEFVVTSVQGFQYAAMLMTIGSHTEGLVGKKVELLMNRVWPVVWSSDKKKNIPFTLFNVTYGEQLVNMECIRKQISEYAPLFGVDKPSLKVVSTNFKIEKKKMYDCLKVPMKLGEYTDDDILGFLMEQGLKEESSMHVDVSLLQKIKDWFWEIFSSHTEITAVALRILIRLYAADAKSVLQLSSKDK